MEFQEIKQQMAEITTDKNKQPVIHPTSRNKETFLNTKLIRKPSNIKQGTLTKDKERNKQKRRPFPVVNKYPKRDMQFQVKPGAVTYSEAVQQKKIVATICESMPKLINLSEIERKLGRKTIVYRKPHVVIVHVGINDVLNRSDQDQIIKYIQQIYITCKNFNVNQVIISGIVSYKRADNSVINYINENLKVESTTEGYQFLDNENIKLENLCRDGMHLRESGKNLLLGNYVNFLYHFLDFIEPYQTVV